jgi:SHS2 domain-containing protein
MDHKTPNFTFIDHTADLGIRVRGKNMKDLFEEAARTMIRIMVSRVSGKINKTIKISINALDLEDLMVRWLGELLYLFEGEKKIMKNVQIDTISETHLSATVKTVLFTTRMHKILNEIKAVTYHQIQVKKTGKCWEARIIFDL